MPDPYWDVASNFTGGSLKFGEMISYHCENGFFEHDKDLQSLTATCLEGGNWTQPDFQKCILPSGKANFMEMCRIYLIRHVQQT